MDLTKNILTTSLGYLDVIEHIYNKTRNCEKITVNLQYIPLATYLPLNFTVIFTGNLFAYGIRCKFMEDYKL